MTATRHIHKKALKITMITIIAITSCVVKTMAQNNKYKINDKLYPIYEQAERQRTTTEGLQLAKDLNRQAIAIGDKKAQCLAHVIPVYYYEAHADQAKFTEAVKNLKAVARKNGYLQYYYFAYNRAIRYLQKQNKQLAAIDELKKMRNEALADKYPYGISTSYQMLGSAYFIRSDFPNAKTNYEQGLKYFKTNVKDQDPTVFYLMLSRLAIREGDLTAATKYIKEGLENTNNLNNRTSFMVLKGNVLKGMNKPVEFLALMKNVDVMMKEHPSNNPEGYYHLKVTQSIMEKKYDEAQTWAEKIRNEEDKNLALRNVAAAKGDWKMALESLSEAYTAVEQRTSEQQTGDLAEMNARFENERLHSEMLEEKMKTDQLMHEREKARREMELITLQNNVMEMQQIAMGDSIDKAKLIIDKTRLKMNNELSAKQVEVEKAQRETLQSKFRMQSVGVFAILLIMLAIIANLAWNKRKSRRFIKQLSDKNDELTVARDKAQQSERMKTMFIQNVSHEIRTPLNAIVGFSNLLVDPSMDASDEEKMEFRDIISNNTNLLTALVNDVLTLSELQSGKAGVKLAQCSPNELCRMAIKTVEHRKPQDVELRFTTDIADDFTIQSDARRISQVLINFLTNAEKYTTQGSITIDCSKARTPGCVTFSVTDTGCGIPEDKREVIFERFEKLDDFHQGMGLGLNICALIANLLDAKIGIDESYTEGARFYLSVNA